MCVSLAKILFNHLMGGGCGCDCGESVSAAYFNFKEMLMDTKAVNFPVKIRSDSSSDPLLCVMTVKMWTYEWRWCLGDLVFEPLLLLMRMIPLDSTREM